MLKEYINCPLCGEKLINFNNDSRFSISYRYFRKCPKVIFNKGNAYMRHHFMQSKLIQGLYFRFKVGRYFILCESNGSDIYKIRYYDPKFGEFIDYDNNKDINNFVPDIKYLTRVNAIIEPTDKLTEDKIKQYILFS